MFENRICRLKLSGNDASAGYTVGQVHARGGGPSASRPSLTTETPQAAQSRQNNSETFLKTKQFKTARSPDDIPLSIFFSRSASRVVVHAADGERPEDVECHQIILEREALNFLLQWQHSASLQVCVADWDHSAVKSSYRLLVRHMAGGGTAVSATHIFSHVDVTHGGEKQNFSCQPPTGMWLLAWEIGCVFPPH